MVAWLTDRFFLKEEPKTEIKEGSLNQADINITLNKCYRCSLTVSKVAIKIILVSADPSVTHTEETGVSYFMGTFCSLNNIF